MSKVMIFAVIVTIFVSASLGAPADDSVDLVNQFATSLRKNVQQYGFDCNNVDEKCLKLSVKFPEEYKEALLRACKYAFKEYLCNGRNQDSDMEKLFADSFREAIEGARIGRGL